MGAYPVSRAGSGACRHCRQPIPAGLDLDGFCCRGCAAVHALLVSQGLGRYYELAGEAPAPPVELSGSRSLAWLEPLLEPIASRPEGELCALTLDIQGIHCAACVWLCEQTFRREPGAARVAVNPALGQATIAFEKGRFDPARWIRAVEAFGYRFGPPLKRPSRASLDLPLRLGVAAALTANVMLFSVSFYFGLDASDPEIFRLFTRLSLALATAVVAVGGWPFFRAAWQGLRRGMLHLDLPIAVGILLVYGTSLARLLGSGADRAYFDTLCVFVTLMLTGRFVQERVLDRNRRFLLEDAGAEGIAVRRLTGARVESVPAPRVRSGDRLLVAPGELVPVDAILTGGRAEFSTDWITGESEPREVERGGAVAAGSFNSGRAAVVVEARAGFAGSPLGALLAASPPEGARRGHRRLWQRLAKGWVGGVALAAVAGVALWLPRDPSRALDVAAALLVVTCPCAIGIAIPMAYELTLHRLRRAGLFVRADDLLDRLLGVRKILFDKTGTLTLGRLELARPEALAELPAAAREAAFNLAVRSAHPTAGAVAAALETAGAAFVVDAEVAECPGAGVEWRRGGELWRLGRGDWAAPGAGVEGTALGRDGRLVLALETREILRAGAREQLASFAARGYEVWLLSGDRPGRVAALARALGIPPERALAGCSPAEKAQAVARLDRDDTLYLGDGVNDALAFARAAAAGTPAIDRPVMPGKSDFFLVGEGLAPLAEALAAARRLRAVVRGLLVAAVAYNAVAVAAALAGAVSPVVAAIVMPASTLVLVGWTVARLAPRRQQALPAPAAPAALAPAPAAVEAGS